MTEVIAEKSYDTIIPEHIICAGVYINYFYMLFHDLNDDELNKTLYKFIENYKYIINLENKNTEQIYDKLYNAIKETMLDDEQYNIFYIKDAKLLGTLILFVIYFVKSKPSIIYEMQTKIDNQKNSFNISDNLETTKMEYIIKNMERFSLMMDLNKYLSNVINIIDDKNKYNNSSSFVYSSSKQYLHFKVIKKI